ncbi:MAG: LamG-like jellyroll fold domain-containing protein [Patescibacteria group bacterium]|nr:LamG-like jellyroll fold domain-containing protein [Patescibacteria group bacterium]
MTKEKSFTLIELLIVIAIIGLLSSIVFVSLKVARERAHIANSLAFGAQTYHALAAHMAGVWNFDEDSSPATTAIDMSGNGNDGIINGATYECGTHDTPNSEGCSLNFDGINDYVDCGDNASLNDISGELTIQAWVYPRNTGSDEYIVSNTGDDASQNGYELKINNNKAEFSIWNSPQQDTITGTRDITLNKWHHIVASFNGKKLELYLDGEIDHRTNSIIGSIGTPASYHLTIGRIGENIDRTIDGLIASIRIYNRAVDFTQVQKLYAQGAEKYNLSTNN